MPAEPPVAAPDHAEQLAIYLTWIPHSYHDAALAALDALLAERQQDQERIERLTEALTNVGDGELGNVCWCGEEWIGDDYPLDEERQHAEWCEAARAVLAGEGDATP